MKELTHIIKISRSYGFAPKPVNCRDVGNAFFSTMKDMKTMKEKGLSSFN